MRERIYHPKPSLGMAAQFRLLIKNDQWLILGAVIAIIMFGGIIRNSVAAYYAKYYLSGGDAFNGAFVYSLIKNMPLIEALKFASATAAINITALGARGHLATPSEVNLFLSQHD